ncbi:glycoside hydrolase family 3 N-terminal domain-containing protein [Symbioplanes lichenis]|uniref:glycoside hydrolase family 3 N-terminal domain-containing protein n=1 Tax=Symbioplanes lichenis TaxID=1629072 RepID=UPI0027397D10|nr:glycoside hydrolase family 3 N-terminal domain-containing protein [Actinoplanes lichenis]
MTTDPGLRRLALGTVLAAFAGPALPDPIGELLSDGLAGVTLFATNIGEPARLTATNIGEPARLTAELRAVKADVLVAADEEGGDVTRLAHRRGSPYPGNAALGAVDDVDLTRGVYAALGADLAAAGINLGLAPVADVNTTDDNPVIGTRSFGSDPALVARHTAAAVTGLQSTGVAACAKHFPGHGATVTDSHLALPTVDAPLDLLRRRDLPPFAAAVAAGARAIMTGHLRVPALTGDNPATFSRAVGDLLRHEYAHRGAILTDALEMRALTTAPGESAVLALSAGADLLCLGARVDRPLVERVVTEIAEATTDGRLPLSRLEEAAARTAALAERPDIGLAAARRALRVEGDPAGFAGALVVRVHAGRTIVEGRVPWGLPAEREITAAATPEELLTWAGGRPVVLCGRRLHRDPGVQELIEALAARHPVAVVEMGWPSGWRPAGVRAFLLTYGAGPANARAASEALDTL